MLFFWLGSSQKIRQRVKKFDKNKLWIFRKQLRMAFWKLASSNQVATIYRFLLIFITRHSKSYSPELLHEAILEIRQSTNSHINVSTMAEMETFFSSIMYLLNISLGKAGALWLSNVPYKELEANVVCVQTTLRRSREKLRKSKKKAYIHPGARISVFVIIHSFQCHETQHLNIIFQR